MGAEILIMKKNFPQLSSFTEQMFRVFSVKDLLMMDSSCSARKKKDSKILSERLSANLEKINESPIEIPPGQDNCSDLLHEARFLRGATGRVQDVWITARNKLGLTGLDPVSHYDSSTLGFNKRLDNQVWCELHNPGSRMISVRMLNPLTLKSTSRLTSRKDEPNLKEFESFQDLRMAMVAMESAIHMIMPWNLSCKTLTIFLHSVEFGENLPAGKPAKLLFVADFIDEVLSTNADAWDNKTPFLSSHEISAKWNSESALKFSSVGRQVERTEPKKDAKKRRDSQTEMNPPNFLCKKFNMGICYKDSDNHPSPWSNDKILKHGCSFFLADQKKFCLKKHSKLNHD